MAFLFQNKDIVDALAQRKMTAFGMDCVPRISRAQVRDFSRAILFSKHHLNVVHISFKGL